MVVMKRALFFTLLVTMFTACMRDNIDETVNLSSKPEYIYASFEEDTRVELNENKKTVWTEGDQIVRIGQDAFDVWTFMGKTGDRSGSFQLYGSADYRFGFDFGGKYYALYSYANFYNTATFTSGEPAFMFFVRAAQVYKPNTYDPESNAMLGISEDGNNFKFRNLLGYLRLSLTGDKSVERISLKGNNGEILSGVRYVKYDDTEVYGWYSDVTTSTTLYCNDPVQLTDIATDFYITIPPTIFEQGISVEVYFTDGSVFPVKTSRQVIVERNTIQPMATVNTGGDIEWQEITIKHSGREVAIPILYGESNIVGYSYWGDGYMTPLGVSGSYVYEDGVDTHDITIKAQNATFIYIDSCAGISEVDLTKF